MKIRQGMSIALACLVLASCNNEEKIEKEKAVAVKQAKEQAKKDLEKYKEEVKKKQTTPYTTSELYDEVGLKYIDIKKGMLGFNKDIDKLKNEEITVYDLNENVTGFSILIKDLEGVDTYKIHEDYMDFYTLLIESASSYIDNLEKFSDAYKLRDVNTIKNVSVDLKDSVAKLEVAEEKVFGTPLGDKILPEDTKKELDKRFKQACKIRIDERNADKLKDLELPKINIKDLSAEELVERREKEKELKAKRKEYSDKASKDYADCYTEFLQERANYATSNSDKLKTKVEKDLEATNKEVKDKNDKEEKDVKVTGKTNKLDEQKKKETESKESVDKGKEK